MAKGPKDSGMVNGYNALRAAQRAKHLDGEGSDALPESSRPIPESGARINRTAMPTKHDITCYECGFEFHMTGKTQVAVCSKCRTKLEVKDYEITDTCTEDVKTAGRIHLTSTGVLNGAVLKGADVRLEGKVEKGEVHAFRRIQLGKGIRYDAETMTCKDLWVLPDASVKFTDAMSFRNLNISGVLNGSITATGTVVINPGGLFQGSLTGRSVEVEEGGGLEADLHIAPPSPDKPKEKQPEPKEEQEPPAEEAEDEAKPDDKPPEPKGGTQGSLDLGDR